MSLNIYKHLNNIIFFILIFFSQIYSPVISDDWFFNNNFKYFLIDRPLATFFIINIHQYINTDSFIDFFKISKIFYIFLNYFLLYKFFSIFIEKNISQIYSFIAIFYPLHDSANYQIWSIVHQFCMILPLYSYYLIEKNKNKLAYIIFILSSFLSYTAIPSQFSIIINMIRNNKKNIFIIFLILFLIYIFYHLFVSLYLNLGTKKIGIGFTDIKTILFEIINVKNIFIHILTFIDIFVGPSHFIKIIYPLLNNSLLTAVLSLILAFYFFKKKSYEKIYETKSLKSLFAIIISVVIISQLLLIISTKFISIPFGLGNRVNIYISLLITLILLKISLPKNKIFVFFIFFIFFLTFFGTNNYWKNVNLKNIELKEEIYNLSQEYTNKQIFMKNVEYVKFFNFKHVELVNFQYSLDHFIKYYNISTNTNKFNLLKEIKLDELSNQDNIIIFNFESGEITKVDSFIDLQKKYKEYNDYYKYRHWIQYLNLSNFKFLLPVHYESKFISNTLRNE